MIGIRDFAPEHVEARIEAGEGLILVDNDTELGVLLDDENGYWAYWSEFGLDPRATHFSTKEEAVAAIRERKGPRSILRRLPVEEKDDESLGPRGRET